MKLIIDGNNFSQINKIRFLLNQYMPKARSIIGEDFINDNMKIDRYLSMSLDDRIELFKYELAKLQDNFTKNLKLRDDVFHVNSPISFYVLERYISDNVEKYDPSFTDYLFMYLFDRIPSNVNICIFENEQIKFEKYSYRWYLPKREEYYKETVRKLQNNDRFTAHYISESNFDLVSTVNRDIDQIDLIYPITFVLDIDDVILDWQGDISEKNFSNKDITKNFIVDFEKYCENGNYEENIETIKEKMNLILEYYDNRMPVNLVILTARDKEENKNFLKLLGNKILYSFINGRDICNISFDPRTNIIADSTRWLLGGSTFFKGYAINRLFSNILDKFEYTTNGLVFFDDRDKYIITAYHSLKFHQKYPDFVLKDRDIFLRSTKINNNKVFCTGSIFNPGLER